MKAVLPMTSAESKRLIAKGAAHLPEMKNALEKGLIVCAGGTTNAFIAEELLNIQIPRKGTHVMGVIAGGVACGIDPATRSRFFVIDQGEPIDLPLPEAAKRLKSGDVFLKGANAIDPEGRTAVLAGSPTGGTIGMAKPYLGPDKAQLVLAVGLEKLIPSIPAAADFAELEEIDAAFGWKLNVLPVHIPGQFVITEIEALHTLTGAKTTLLGAGGVGGSEGSVVLGIEGNDEQVKAALDLCRSIKGEPPVAAAHLDCAECERPCSMMD